MGARSRIRIGIAGAVLLFWLAVCAVVWETADGHLPIRRAIRPGVLPNELVIRAELSLWSGLIVYPGADVEAKCEAESDGYELTFTCRARRLNGARL